MRTWGKGMGKRILIGSMLVLAMLLLMPSIPAIQQSNNETSYKPTIRPIRFDSYISLDVDTSELNSPIPPGHWVGVPITIEYRTDIPDMFKKIPFPLNNLILFHRFIAPIQKIYFESSDTSDEIDVYFTQNPVLTDIPFSGEKSESSTYMIILIGENTPSNSYLIHIEASCNDIHRVSGTEVGIAIEFTVG